MINPIDKLVELFAPQAAARRAHARRVLSYYEAARPTKQRKQRKETGSGDAAVFAAGSSIREQARHLDQNHDLSRGILNTLVQNVIGPTGIGVEPMPRNKRGELMVDLARTISNRYRLWSERPDVTWRMDRPAMERLAGRSWLRDGDVFAQTIAGPSSFLQHGTPVSLSVELIEADMVPLDYNGTYGQNQIFAGVEMNAWRRPMAYHMYKSHPGDTVWFGRMPSAQNLKRVTADRMLHLQMMDSRIGSTRGMSLFAAIMGRIQDVKEYEESENVAAKVAASMAAYIKKAAPDMYEPLKDEDGEILERELKFRPGLIFDDLGPGEEIGMIDSSRPNTSLEAHRNGQLRALASGSYLTYSSLSRNYSGTYSSQRQELVEGYGAYGVLASEFINQFTRPLYKAFLNAEMTYGGLILPADLDIDTLDDALFLPPHMPWIDPLKEAQAYEILEQNGHASGPEIIRRRGQRPDTLIEQEKAWREDASQLGPLPAGFGGSSAKTTTNQSTGQGNTNARTRQIAQMVRD